MVVIIIEALSVAKIVNIICQTLEKCQISRSGYEQRNRQGLDML